MILEIRIQRGDFKGRAVPTPPAVQGALNATPALVKKAVFQVIENRIGLESAPNTAFFDLCAGSGQMAFEALSLGFHPVHLCEVNAARFKTILGEIQKRTYDARIHKRDFRRAAALVIEPEQSVVYLDVPYSFWAKNDCPAVREFLAALAKLGPLYPSRTILIVIQGPAFLDAPEMLLPGWEVALENRKYRRTCLTILDLVSPAKAA